MPTLALIDGNSIAYRAFYALPEDLATKSGQVTNAVFGFTRMLIRLLKDYHPEGIAVAWDVSRHTFRTDSYPEYKAQREKAPDHFRSQLPLMDEVLQTLHVTQLRQEGYEADDLIATLTKRAVADGWDVLIVTGDRDAFQLGGGPVKVVYTRRGISDTVLADVPYIEERYGIRPDQYVDYAALRGDNSDNLPGVPGVGEKTASRLIADYGDLDNLYLAVTEQTPRLRDNLSAHRDQVFLNRDLMTLVDDLELGVTLDEFRTREWDRSQVKDLFDSLEFHSMWSDLEEALPSTVPVSELVEVDCRLVTGFDEVAAIARDEVLIAALVTDGGEPFGLAVSTGPGQAVVIPFDSAGPLLEALAGGEARLAGHDVKDLVRTLLDLDHDVARLEMDTALAAYVVNPSQRTYVLEELAERLLGLELVSPDDETETAGMLPFQSGPDLEVEGRRIEAVRRLVEVMRGELNDRDERELFEEFELPLVPVLARMEHAGI
ncbi:MAG TPA: 5'-3' exonuclease H3TH domain-containing protein, partial [Acidimicrobiia bacterium]|nr:5'-3' exonuclease H3TH domain-containing protein [Acidimicrobiia bacterium]